jgi:hypothetical protein
MDLCDYENENHDHGVGVGVNTTLLSGGLLPRFFISNVHFDIVTV